MRLPLYLLLALLPMCARADDGPAVHARLLKSTGWLRTTTEGVGTGWVVDAKRRWLITNLHVVGDQDRVEVFFPVERDGKVVVERQFYLENQKSLHEEGRAVRGKVIRRDEKSDLALVELDKLPEGIVAISLAEKAIGPGEIVHSIGNRHDAEALWLHTTGEVRQLGRLTDGYFWRGKKLATDVACLIAQSPIQPGDSGGALVNGHCEVVGVLSGGRWQAQTAAITIQVSEVRRLLTEAAKTEVSALKKEPASGTEIYLRLLMASVWVRPTATEGRAAGFVVDKEHRLVLTTATGAGASDLVDVVFPIFEKGELRGELVNYADRIGLRQSGQMIRGVVLARDPKRDFALIEVEALPEKARQLSLGKKEPAAAEKVHALSHPSGVEFLWLYSAGTVRQAANVELVSVLMGESAKPRSLLLQIPHQGGSAGGPVVNERGELVGMLAAKEAAQQQLGYAIAAAELDAFIESARPLFAPKTGEDFRKRGERLLAFGKIRDGSSAYLEAMKLDMPRSKHLARELADALLRLGDSKGAAALCGLLLDQKKPTAADLARVAHAEACSGKTEQVRARCVEIFKQDAKVARAYLARGLVSSGKEALADFDEAIFLDAKLVEAYRARAALCEKRDDYDKALADYSRAIELDPYFPDTIRRRAALYLKRNEPKRAVADCERLIDLLPRDAASYRALAGAWLVQGDEAQALPALVGALRWDPGLLKDILNDVLKYGAELVKKWPDDPEKRGVWYQQALAAIRGAIKDEETRKRIDAALQSRKADWDTKMWGDELEKRIRALTQ
jgi:S1-C subfamily serine protease